MAAEWWAMSEEDVDVEQLFTLFARAHMLDVVYKVSLGGDPPMRYNELEEQLDVSSNTLSRRLAELVESDFLERTAYEEIPPRVEYEPTEKLLALEPTFRELGAWLAEYGDDEDFALPPA